MTQNISKKKRRKKKYRLESSRDWIRNYLGKNIVIDYSKWYGVDLICSIKELRLNGIEVTEEFEEKVKKSIALNKQRRKLKRLEFKKNEKQKIENEISDDRFAFIAGYTSGGAAFGITHEEMSELSAETIEEISL